MRTVAILLCALSAPLIGFAESPDVKSQDVRSPKTSASRTTTNVASVRQTAPPPLLTEDMAARWIKLWQKRLALEDWKIDVKIVRVWELPDNAVANIHWSLPTHRATVKVLNAVDSTLKKSEIVDDTEL